MHQSFVLRLRGGALEEYIAHHESIPSAHPDLARALVDSGVTALRIFHDGDRLVLCVEGSDEHSMERLWATEAHRRWSELMDPLIEIGPDGVPEARFLERIYEFRADMVGGPTAADTVGGPGAADTVGGPGAAATAKDA